jgi:hypothetical protein
MSNNFRLTTTAALGLLLASVAAPIALADVPGYEFQDLDQQSSAVHSGITARAATDAQIAAANRNADEALALARQALRDAQQAQQPMQHAVQQR